MFGDAAVEFCSPGMQRQHLVAVTPRNSSLELKFCETRYKALVTAFKLRFYHPRKSAGEGRQGGRGQHLVLVLQLNCFKLLKHWGSFLTYFRAGFRNCWDVFCSVCMEFSWITEERNFVGLLVKSDLF